MRRRDLIAAMAGCCLFAACGSEPGSSGMAGKETNTLRYKMTVEVDTPLGMRSGYAVREMTLSTDNIMRPATGGLKGEAVAIDLPEGRTLFALLTGGNGDIDYAMQIGGRAEVWGKSPGQQGVNPVELWPTAPKTVGLANTDPLPMLVEFRNLNDPSSVERIDPSNLEAHFGHGVKLRRIELQATDAPVTTGIGKRLNWLKSYYNRQLDGQRYNNSQSLPNSLNVISFQRGIDQWQ